MVIVVHAVTILPHGLGAGGEFSKCLLTSACLIVKYYFKKRKK